MDVNENGSEKRFPLIAEPPMKINGIPIIRKAYQAALQRQSKALPRKLHMPAKPHVKPNEISRNGMNERNCIWNALCAVLFVVMVSFFLS
jgi:hypothetical protein